MFKVKYRVSFVETDSAGIVHFSNYFRYFERAEEELYNSIGRNLDFVSLMKKYGYTLPRVEAHCKYFSPLRFNDVFEVRIWVEEVKEKSIKYGFEIYNITTDKLSARGYVVVVAANLEKGVSVPLDKEFVELILKATKKENKKGKMKIFGE